MNLSFAHPWVLLFLVVPLLLLIWQWGRHGHRVTMPFDHGVQGRGAGWRVVLGIAHSLPKLLLAVVIAILAGPQQLSDPKTKKVLTNIEFAVDVSGSMTAKFGEGSRYDASMEALNGFIDYREGDAFGLTFFGGHVLHFVPLTSDVSAFACAPPFMRPENLPRWFSGGTMIGMALKECRKVLIQREEGDRMIILISDGQSFDLSGGQGEAIARQLREDRIVVYGIHVAGGGPPVEVATVASITGGEVFAAGDPAGLDAVFKRIDEMQETRIEKTSAETMDNFVPLSLAGLGIGALSLLSLFGIRYTPW